MPADRTGAQRPGLQLRAQAANTGSAAAADAAGGERAVVEQILTESGAGIDCAATRDGVFQVRSYPSAHIGSRSSNG